MPLLYPGYKGTPENEPFKTFHDQLLERLLEADLIVVVGFAFRDPYVNNMFDTALRINSKARLYCFNPASNDKLPKESSIRKFKETYDKFKHIEEGISLQEKAINITPIEADYLVAVK